MEHLIIVAGHAVYVAPDFARPAADESWLLQPFQRGEPPFYIEHIKRGVELAAADTGALLMFSGGPTRREAGPRSEADGYWRVADHFGWLSYGNVRERAVTEEFARDSLENMLFGLCRFRALTGRYPVHLTAVSWAFKAARFDLHRAALRWPAEKFSFVGANNPLDLADAGAGELRQALEPFRQDPYGAQNPLAAKRSARDPFQRQPPYAQTCPEIAGLLNHRGPEIYAGPLLWE